jgi:hypothetical protein
MTKPLLVPNLLLPQSGDVKFRKSWKAGLVGSLLFGSMLLCGVLLATVRKNVCEMRHLFATWNRLSEASIIYPIHVCPKHLGISPDILLLNQAFL